MKLEKLPEILKRKKLTLDEIQFMLQDYSIYEISRYIMTNPNLVQSNGLLHDNKIRFTAISDK